MLLLAQLLLAAPNYLFQSASVIDGTGAPARSLDVRVQADRIAAIAPHLQPAPSDTIIKAKGLVLAPGFIALHNHSGRGLSNEPAAISQVSQGITTAVFGMDGGSSFPIKDPAFLATSECGVLPYRLKRPMYTPDESCQPA